ncbi:ubiquitin fusion degradation protein [Coemansia sp. Benny D115]|nr:ubiquitin fusion degradation protein [Coemansia sp. Benny D115]
MYSDDDSDEYVYDTMNSRFNTGMQGYNMGYSQRQRTFTRYYSAYSIATNTGSKADANYGGKIFMPPSALEEISHLEVVYPLLFKLQNDSAPDGKLRRTHCGVLEFTAEEGRVYLPQWMMETLCLTDGSAVEVINVALLHGEIVKLQPQSPDFLEISDPGAVLENAFRKFSALTVGDILAFEYNDREYHIAVIETQPSPTAINIVEVDLKVDFAPPVGYVEPTRVTGANSRASNSSSVAGSSRPSSSIAKDIKRKEVAAKDEISSSRFAAFRGAGSRLSSKPPTSSTAAVSGDRPASVRSYASNALEAESEGEQVKNATSHNGDPVPLDLPIGTLFFGYDLVPPPGSELDNKDDGAEDDKDKFQGSGRALRTRRKR